jgi:hypothetical protein
MRSHSLTATLDTLGLPHASSHPIRAQADWAAMSNTTHVTPSLYLTLSVLRSGSPRWPERTKEQKDVHACRARARMPRTHACTHRARAHMRAGTRTQTHTHTHTLTHTHTHRHTHTHTMASTSRKKTLARLEHTDSDVALI